MASIDTLMSRATIFAFFNVITLLCTITLLTLTYHNSQTLGGVNSLAIPKPSPATQIQTCGSSVAEAISLGCTFDPLTVYWLPPSCTRIASDDFVAYGRKKDTGWQYWRDLKGEDPITDLPSTLGEMYYTTESEHMAHCAFMLIRLAATATGEGIRADDMTLDYHHSKHCVMMMLNATLASPSRDKINSFGKVQLGTC